MDECQKFAEESEFPTVDDIDKDVYFYDEGGVK